MGFRTAPAPVPYYPWGWYGIYPDPYGGGLSGAADAIAAQGQFQIDFQHARLLNQEVERSKMDTRRRQWEEWLYEREHTPTVEDIRERQRMENLRRARNNPPFAEIWSGQALNDLLEAVQRQQAHNGPGPVIALDDETLQRINVTSGVTPAGAGLLRDGGRLRWPFALQEKHFAEARKRVDELMARAVQQAQSGQADAETLRELTDTINKLRAEVRNRIDTVSINDNVVARRYLNDLDGAVRALQSPNVGQYLSGRWAARGRTVGELVAEMSRQGLRFAPATDGDEAAYTALHRALANYSTLPDPSRPWDAMAK
jgi:hypothetical protein